jgi:hypothetical protein
MAGATGSWRHSLALLFLACVAANCGVDLPYTPLTERWHLEVATTQSTYSTSDSVFVEMRNLDIIPFAWHRCPGVLLQRQVANGWEEVSDGSTCSDRVFVLIASGETRSIVFVMPGNASGGVYRIQVRLSPVDERSPQFWWPSGLFTVTGTSA